MDKNLIWQYAVVIAIVLAALAKIIMGLRKIHKNPHSGGCPGCSMYETCKRRHDLLRTPQGKNPEKSGEKDPEKECGFKSGNSCCNKSGHDCCG